MLYSAGDFSRETPVEVTKREISLRSHFRRDFARLIHSPAFRRLQGKTQLFPGIESDFFRNRLTHSLEVAQIAKSIAIRINESRVKGRHKNDKIDLDLVEFAGLAHDLGHPPFGHNGEDALDQCMREYGGFEGNAQTLRILSKLEKKGDAVSPFPSPDRRDLRNGLNLTYRTLATILKYDSVIPLVSSQRPREFIAKPMKGYYKSEEVLVGTIKQNVVGNVEYAGNFKTIECQIMDLADDIAYSTYDLEDALKAGFVSPLEILNDSVNVPLTQKIAEKVKGKTKGGFDDNDVTRALMELFFYQLFPSEEIKGELSKAKKLDDKYWVLAERAIATYESSLTMAQDGYSRNKLTSFLVNKFISQVKCDWNHSAPAFSQVYFSDEVFPVVETLKNYTFIKLIESSRLKVAEYRGSQIVKDLFSALDDEDKGASLLPDDFRAWRDAAPSEEERKRVVCDFIAGMTDNYAIEFYGRLKSVNPQSIFKPI